jgi:hypothetical protein
VEVRIGEKAYSIREPQDLERLCLELRRALYEGRECAYNSWYIRVPPERILEILKEAYSSYLKGEAGVGPVVERYLERLGLSKSLARTITPTLSALGLSSAGAFSKTALEAGRSLYGGAKHEALAILREAAAKNCVLRDIMVRLGGRCEGLAAVVEDVLRSYGKSPRADEVKYTAELVRLLYPPCAPCNFACINKEAFTTCADSLVEAVMANIGDLFEKLDISILPSYLAYVKSGASYRAFVKDTNKPVGLIALAEPIEGAQIGRLRDLSRALDALVEEGAYEFYVKVLPILEPAGSCYRLKAYVEVARADLERASRIIKLD